MKISNWFKLFTWLLLLNGFSPSIAQQSTGQTLNPNSSQYLQGFDYKVIDHKITNANQEQPQSGLVTDIEFFYWYGCEPCQQVELALARYLDKYPDLTIKRTPLVAYVNWRQHAYIQPLMSQLAPLVDKALPTIDEVYQACISDCSVFSSYELTKVWFQRALELDQLPTLNRALIWQTQKDQQKRAESFSISQVPTIIIRQSYFVDANSAKSLTRLMDIVDYLLNEVTQPIAN